MNKDSCCSCSVDDAVEALHQGHLIVYPTDTLYALGCDVCNDDAVKRLFEVKQRPFSLPLPVAVSDVEMMQSVAFVSDDVKKVVSRFLPGSLTVIVPKKEIVSEFVSAGFDTVAIRIPDNCFALSLVKRFGPVCVTSANIHSKSTGCTIEDIKKEFGSDVFLYVDGGILNGKASTIVDMSGECVTIVRKGPICLEDIMGVLK